MKEVEYVIVGDTEQFGECLVFVCGSSLQTAKMMLEKNKNKGVKGHTNLRIKEVPADECWWNWELD